MSSAILLTGGRLYSGDAVDELLRRGRIAAVADLSGIDTRDAEPVALDGRFIGPGMWDAHVHLRQAVI